MASTTQVVLVDPTPTAHREIRRRLEELEHRWSRFLPSSDLSRLNSSPGVPLAVGADTIRLVDAMCLANHATGGRYDPTLLHQLITLGYSTSIDDSELITVAVDSRRPDQTINDAQIDRRASTMMLPVGLSIDPGGIGKGFAADLVVTEALESGTAGALVSIGGDIAAAGRPPTDGGWLIDVADPFGGGPVTTIQVSAGGIATSSTRSRRWTSEGESRHHLIDPITGTMSLTDLASVTVVASAGWLAEAHASAALLCGSAGAMAYLVDHGLSGIVIDADGDTTRTSDLLVPDPTMVVML